MALPLLRSFLAPALRRPAISRIPLTVTFPSSSPLPSAPPKPSFPSPRTFASTPARSATLNQVLRGCRKPQRARHHRSPALADMRAPEMKGVCLRVGVTRPKKPNSGERKTARIRLSNGRMITAIIPGEGHNIAMHSVVLVRGGRAQDCPGVRYHCVRGAGDLGGVPNRTTSRSKYGSKKPKKASIG